MIEKKKKKEGYVEEGKLMKMIRKKKKKGKKPKQINNLGDLFK